MFPDCDIQIQWKFASAVPFSNAAGGVSRGKVGATTATIVCAARSRTTALYALHFHLNLNPVLFTRLQR